MRHLITSTLFILLAGLGLAQQRVALHSSGTTTIFGGSTPLVDAYTAAVNGDTIYIPGGLFSAPAPFDKKVTMIGAGIHVDSTNVIEKTRISSTITFLDGSDGSHIEGIWFMSSLNVASDEDVDSLLIRRCYIESDINISGSTPSTVCTGIRIEECIIDGSVTVQHTENIELFNNVLYRLYNISSNGWIANNIFLYNGHYNVFNVQQSLFENNYFESWYSGPFTGCNNNTFLNNAFHTSIPGSDLGNTYVNSYYPVTESALFISSGNPNLFETSDYHLNDPATYVGTTGDAIGIYGGYSPVKAGWVPFNPHYSSATIAPSTDPSGQLNIQIQVEAQDN
jgi:hypothetical protein